MKVLRALLALTLTGCHAASPLDESPQLDLDSGLAGAWRCMLADVEETDEAWVTVAPHPTDERLYSITWREGTRADAYEAFASSVGDSLVLNVREAGDASGWAFLRYDLLRPNLLLLAMAREGVFDGATSSADVRAALEAALNAGAAFEDFMVCVGARRSPPDS